MATNGFPVAKNDFYVPVDRSSDMDEFEPSMTRQEFAEECDINTIMAQYEKHGVINHYNRQAPAYLDLTDVPDLASALRVLNDADAAFMTLSARLRAEFDNDPVKFVAFAEKGENLEKMREWGLAPPPPAPPEPVIVRVVPDPAGSPPPPGGVSPAS